MDHWGSRDPFGHLPPPRRAPAREEPPPLPVPPWIADIAPDLTAAVLPVDETGAHLKPAAAQLTALSYGHDVSATEAALLRAELWRELRDVQRRPP